MGYENDRHPSYQRKFKIDMKEKISLIATIVIAVLLSAGIIWGVWTLVSTTSKTDAVVSFLNKELAAQQQPQAASVTK